MRPTASASSTPRPPPCCCARPALLLLSLLLLGHSSRHHSRSPSVADARYPGPIRGRNSMPEEERINAFHTNGYEWPPSQIYKGWPPEPAGPEPEAWARSRDKLEARIRKIKDSQLRWDEWTQLVQTRLMPQFSPAGFKKMKAPEAAWKALYDNYQSGRATAGFEMGVGRDMMSDDQRPRFIYQQQLNNKIMEDLRPLAEQWAGCELISGQAYGVRIYQNGSTLVNHIDRVETHVISFILHIDSDLDEPWPLEIEDHQGNVHAVVMEPGEMIFYESAKKYHSRLTPMRGRHYGSLFVHYFPRHNWNWTSFDVTVGVPPGFMDQDVGDRNHIYDLGPTNIDEYYANYWKSRGMAPRKQRVGINNPVQTFALEDHHLGDL